MKKILGAFSVLFIFLFTSMAVAQDMKVGVVNINQLFTDSPFVKQANEQLQTNVKAMESKVQAQQQKVQDLAIEYEKAADKDKPKLRNEIQEEQSKLNQMTQDYQQQIKDEQSRGMEKFSEQVKAAVVEVAKKRNLNAVLANTAIIYNDDSLVDVTEDVAKILKQQ